MNPSPFTMLQTGDKTVTMETTFPFSCDLAKDALIHRLFLEKLRKLRVSQQPISHESLRRYRDLWLPLVHRNPYNDLIPPPDIAWLWHCHRLAPYEYVTYTTRRFGSTVEARLPFALQTFEEQSHETSPSLVTRLLWKVEYGNEPFFLPRGHESLDFSNNNDRSIGGFNLLRATKRHAAFLVSDKRFGDTEFLQKGQENYCKFLKLSRKAAEREFMLIPTTQIDFMRRTHILSSVTEYNKDCKAIMGAFHHQGKLFNDRIPGGLDIHYRKTRQLWMEQYHEEYEIPPAMNGGEPLTDSVETNWTFDFFDINWNCADKQQDVTGETALKESTLGTELTEKTISGPPMFSDPRAAGKQNLPQGEGWRSDAFLPTNVLRAGDDRVRLLDSKDTCGRDNLPLNETISHRDAMRARSGASTPTGEVRRTIKDPTWDSGSTPWCAESACIYMPFMWTGFDGLCGGADVGASTACCEIACEGGEGCEFGECCGAGCCDGGVCVGGCDGGGCAV